MLDVDNCLSADYFCEQEAFEINEHECSILIFDEKNQLWNLICD